MSVNAAVKIVPEERFEERPVVLPLAPTPTVNRNLPFRLGDFETLAEGLDYAARGRTGLNFYSVRGELDATLSYAELREDAIDLARKLVRLNLPAGSRVALVAETMPDFHRFFFACQYASLLPVQLPLPMNLGAKDAYVGQIRRMIRSAAPAIAVASPRMIDLLRFAVDGLDIPFVGTPEEFHALSVGPDLRPAGPDDPSYIQYSSGSTSEPKGILVTQRSATANVAGITAHGLKLRPGDRCVSWLPLYHDMGLIGFCVGPVLSQLSIDYLATADFARRPLQWLRLISENGGTIAFSPTFGYDLCRRRGGNGASAGLDLSTWRVAGIGADMVRSEVLDGFAETFAPRGFSRRAFLPSYGLAESTLAVSFTELDEEIRVDTVDKDELADSGRAVAPAPEAKEESKRAFVICGKALPGHEIEIRDAADRPLGERQVGRVVVRGPSVMDGFFGEPERTARVLSKDGWLDTGDLGYLVEGSLVITGRGKDLIISNGRNIWPQDIEWAVEQLPEVRSGDIAAFSVEGEDGETVVSVVQCRAVTPEAREDLRHRVTATIRKAVGLDCTVVLAPPRGVPMTSSGKISRSRAKARYLEGGYGLA